MAIDSILTVARSELSSLLKANEKILINAKNLEDVAVFRFESNGVGHTTNNLETALVTPVEFARLVFHVFAIESDTMINPLKINKCRGAFGDVWWNAVYTPIDDGFFIEIVKDSNMSLDDFLRSEMQRLRSFGEDYRANSKDDPQSYPLYRAPLGSRGWQTSLRSYADVRVGEDA
ncbi:conserved hypothetical protein [Vibrio chagasii]|nr:conserved hypothetical protein [Vibrio chagasii]